MKQTCIALTGPSGAGKSIAGEAFRSLGIPVLDTDAIYHDLMDHSLALKAELADAFALRAETLSAGNLRPLRTIVWRDPKKLLRLNAISHRHIKERVEELCAEEPLCEAETVVLDAPVILDSPIDWAPDYVVSVLADPEVRRARILARDPITPKEADARIRGQHPDDFYIERSDLVLYNPYDSVQTALREMTRLIREQLLAWNLNVPGDRS